MAVADATGDAMVVAVGLHSKKNSFLNVKRTVLRHVAAGKEVTTANDLVFRLTTEGNRHVICSVATDSFIPETDLDDVRMNSAVAASVCGTLKTAVLTPLLDVTPAKLRQVWIEPLNEDDWEILEMNAAKLQETLLDQVRFVGAGSTLVLFAGNIPIHAVVEKLKPNCSFGELWSMTEVIVKPRESKGNIPSLPPRMQQPTMGSATAVLGENVNVFFDSLRRASSLSFRLFSSPQLCHGELEAQICINDVVLHGQVVVRFLVLPMAKEDMGSPVRTFALKCSLVDKTQSHGDFPPDEVILVSQGLLDALGLDSGTRVRLERCCADDLDVEGKITVLNKSSNNNEVVEKEVSQCLRRRFSDFPLVLPNKIMLPMELAPGRTIRLIFPEEKSLQLESMEQLRESLAVTDSSFEQAPVSPNNENPCDRLLLPGLQDCIDSCLLALRDCRLAISCLLEAPMGSGKTSALRVIEDRLQSFPILAHAAYISCKSMIGKRTDLIIKSLDIALQESRYYGGGSGGAVLLLDDLDCLCSNNQEEQSWAQKKQLHTLCSSVLAMLGRFKAEGFSIVATVASVETLNPHLLPARGKQHCFQKVIRLGYPTEEQRRLLLLAELCDSKFQSLVGRDTAVLDRLTQGFTLKDISRLASNLRNKLKMGLLTNANAVQDSIRAFRPLALWNVKLATPPKSTFNDVGGLRQAKKILTQTILWPGQYPDLFEQSLMKNRSGLLLYGPPGTGKTLIAQAAARECGINFITIKGNGGPELLSKYIGASEASVRETFRRARSAKPCLLFFDEFESIAPRRGHDNTGVTDRVVNQFLTELDGVEDLQGQGQGQVFVLAATSRPDLVDPALLRPGRLDKKVYCPMPDQAERLEILRTLSGRMPMSEDAQLSLQELADVTEGMTGADLQALLHTAQLNAHKRYSKREASTETKILTEGSDSEPRGHPAQVLRFCAEEQRWTYTTTRKPPEAPAQPATPMKTLEDAEVVEKHHLMKAFEGTRPSVSQEELQRYSTIYENFDSSGMKRRRQSLFPVDQVSTLA